MSGTNNANNLGRESSNAANSVADGIGGVFKEVKGEWQRREAVAQVASSAGSIALPMALALAPGARAYGRTGGHGWRARA